MPDSETIPAAQPQPRFYYGWVIVGVMAAGAAVSMAMGSLNFGLFVKPMGDELGIGRSMFGWAQTARQVSSATTSPLVGSLIDRFGARVMLPVAALLTGGAMIGLGFSHTAWQLILMFAVMGIIGMSGPGSLVTTVPVLKWFIRDRGRAVSFMSLGIPIGAVIFLPLTQWFIDIWGWRGAWIGLAILALCVIVPLSVILVRRQPEDLGLKPDGLTDESEPPEHAEPLLAQLPLEVGWTVREAVHNPTFWRLVVIFSVFSLGSGLFSVHRIPSFMDRGLNPNLISFATAFDAVCAGASTFTMGFLVRKYPPRVLGSAGLALLAVAGILTIYGNTLLIMTLSMAVFGLGVGGTMFLQNFLWADYFGRTHLGGIRGVVNPVVMVIGGIGAPLAGYVDDTVGSYTSIWWVAVGLLFFAAAALLFTVAPSKPRTRERDSERLAGIPAQPPSV